MWRNYLRKLFYCIIFFLFYTLTSYKVYAESPVQVSGIYPHLAMFGDIADGLPDNVNELGLGAVVSWANKVWVLTYPPHAWNGGQNKLYEIDPNTLSIIARLESVGGTHAGRLIHQESNQLIVGPYFINSSGEIKVIPPSVMPGRITAISRHFDSNKASNKVLFYTMEQGLYEVDVNFDPQNPAAGVIRLHQDANSFMNGITSDIPNCMVPGAHGKGAYSGQDRLIVVNNGLPRTNPCPYPTFSPTYLGGVLAEWNGAGDPNLPASWVVDSPNKFTDVTGPGGIYGSPNNNSNIWAIGWDNRSAILKLLENGQWITYRLPKGTYTYDEKHGWNTEWPRIHKINDGTFIMDMYGMLYQFPETFSQNNSSGIIPISSHLAVINNIIRSNNQLVIGGNDTLWTNIANPTILHPGNLYVEKPNSNLRFINASELSGWGKPYGNGGPWYKNNVYANQYSQPYLLAGFDNRILHIAHSATQPVTFTIEVDINGNNNWTPYQEMVIPAGGYDSLIIPQNFNAQWIRLKSDKDINGVTAYLNYSSKTPPLPNFNMFKSLASSGYNGSRSEGILRPKNETLQYVANIVNDQGQTSGSNYYEIGETLNIIPIDNSAEKNEIISKFAVLNKGFDEDDASVIITDENNNKFRLPKNESIYSQIWATGWPRMVRQAVVDRYLMNVHGTIYELPFPEAGGIQKVRPITTHNKLIYDFASWRGMLVLAGTMIDAIPDGHFFKSSDNQAGLWFGNIDDLWKMGPPVGRGGPWYNTPITANVSSDPYLMTGYINKRLDLSHTAQSPVNFTIEIDFAGDGSWYPYQTLTVNPGEILRYKFPDGYNAHWVRLKSNTSTNATAIFTYSAPLTNFSLIDIKTTLINYLTDKDLYTKPADNKVNMLDISYITNLILNPLPSPSPYTIPDLKSSPTPVPTPFEHHIYKQTVLPANGIFAGKRIWIRYQKDDLSWTKWGDLFENLPTLGTNNLYRSYDQSRWDDNSLQQSLLTNDGLKYWWRQCTWEVQTYSCVPNWTFGDLQNIPVNNSNWIWHAFDQAALPPDNIYPTRNRLKETLIKDEGNGIWWRKGYWNGTTYTDWTDWQEDVGTISSIAAAGFSGYDMPKSINHIKLADGSVKQSVLSNDGRKVISRTLSAAGVWSNWGVPRGEEDLSNLIPGQGTDQMFLSWDEITMP